MNLFLQFRHDVGFEPGILGLPAEVERTGMDDGEIIRQVSLIIPHGLRQVAFRPAFQIIVDGVLADEDGQCQVRHELQNFTMIFLGDEPSRRFVAVLALPDSRNP